MNYAVYDSSSGRILRMLSCPEDHLAVNLQTGEQALSVDAGVSDATHYIANGAPVAFPAPPASFYSWDWSTKQWVDARTVAQAQSMKIGALTAAYFAAIAQPVSYTSQGGVAQTFQSDEQSVKNLSDMLLAFAGTKTTPAGFYWVAADNTQVPFTYADMQALAAVIGAQGFAAFANLQAKKAAVRSAATIADVDAIRW